MYNILYMCIAISSLFDEHIYTGCPKQALYYCDSKT